MMKNNFFFFFFFGGVGGWGGPNSIGGSKEGGQGGHGPPKGLTKIIKKAQFVAFCIIYKKIFPVGMPTAPP